MGMHKDVLQQQGGAQDSDRCRAQGSMATAQKATLSLATCCAWSGEAFRWTHVIEKALLGAIHCGQQLSDLQPTSQEALRPHGQHTEHLATSMLENQRQATA